MKIVFEDIEIIIVKRKKRVYKNWNNSFSLKKLNSFFKMIREKRFKLKKVLAGFMTALILFAQSPYSLAIAQSVPEAPSAPTAPTPPPEPVIIIEEPVAPEAPTAPTAPEIPTLEQILNPSPTPTPTPKPIRVKSESTTSDTQNTKPSSSTNSSDQSAGGNVNTDTNIASGDATNNANIDNTGNSNITVVPSASTSVGTSGGVSVANTGNGSGSSNTGSVGIVDNTVTTQNNSAGIENNLTQVTTTGDNDASRNTGGDSSISTGDANTTGTILNSVNTNLAGVDVYEFNIVDDHIGDYVLDFNQANCISGCGGGDISVINSDNGSDTTNNGNVDLTDNNNTFQTNDASLQNNMVLVSDSGNNTADKNTNSDSSIETGDANVSGNILNFVNNNFAGEVVYAVVNIFGDLIGDIILPDGTVFSCCGGSTLVENSGNGADSSNTANTDQSTNNDLYQFNNADIENNLVFSSSTGNNEASKNTNGNSSVETGDTSIIAQVTNIANLNLLGGNYWLVIVNEAGRWIGKILGASDNANYAGSEIFEFVVDEYGQVTVMNSGNGTGSTNTAGVNQEVNNTVVQNNNANIVNNVYLSANTGDNSASKNTGGDSSIKTGDANVIANIVNFVNNNIIGSGKLFVTVVNVFGKWVGDFVGPGYTKEAKSQNALGGASDTNYQPSGGSSSVGNLTENQPAASEITEPASGTKSKVLALFAGAKSASNPASEESSDDQLILAGGSDEAAAGDKVVNINLAWLIFAIPLIVFYLIKKKKLVFLRLLPVLNKGNA